MVKEELHSKVGLLQSFRCAGRGILDAAQGRNFKIELAIGVMGLLLCWVLKVSTVELLVVVVFCALVLAGECLNSAVEAVVDLVSPEKSDLAKIAKDCSAGAVLVMSIGALIAACILFLPRIIALIG